MPAKSENVDFAIAELVGNNNDEFELKIGICILLEKGNTTVVDIDVLPTDIDIDYASVPFFQQYADPEFELEFIIVVANQFGSNKVNVFGFGRHKSMNYGEE